MKSLIRHQVVAAAMLLVPMGAALLPQPATAAHASARAEVAQPGIRSVALNSDAALEPGATLRLRVQATPGARRTVVRLGDSGIRVRLREQSPGNYVGRYVVRRADHIDPTQLLLVRVNYGERRIAQSYYFPPGFQALAARTRDRHAPQIYAVTPAHRDRISSDRRTRLTARLSDVGTGVDPASVRLRVDGRDVTDEARISAERVRFRDDLPRGRHTAELIVRDHAGNASRAVWTFDVV